MPVKKYLDLSTAHIPNEDREILDGKKGAWIVTPHRYGWWVYVPLDSSANPTTAGFSPAFCSLIGVAIDNGCRWINFDQDASIDPKLPVFDWEGAR